jgi:hypothetical protein
MPTSFLLLAHKKRLKLPTQKKKKKRAQDPTSSPPLAQSWLSFSFSTHSCLSLLKRGHSCPFLFSYPIVGSSLKEAKLPIIKKIKNKNKKIKEAKLPIHWPIDSLLFLRYVVLFKT